MLCKPFANVPQVNQEKYEQTEMAEQLELNFITKGKGPVSFCEADKEVQDIDTPYLIFVCGELCLEFISTDCTQATTGVVQKHKLRIPYVAFHHDSDTYLFVQKGHVNRTAEDTVASFLEHVGDSIHTHSNHEKDTWNRIKSYEVRRPTSPHLGY